MGSKNFIRAFLVVQMGRVLYAALVLTDNRIHDFAIPERALFAPLRFFFPGSFGVEK